VTKADFQVKIDSLKLRATEAIRAGTPDVARLLKGVVCTYLSPARSSSTLT
jgi:hypothetical protein